MRHEISTVPGRGVTVLVATLLALGGVAMRPGTASAAAGDTLVVTPSGPLRTVGTALRAARPGTTILVRSGTYREPTIVVDRGVTIVGERGATLDGDGARQIMTITADDVTVRGLRFTNVGASFTEDRAAIRVSGARGCVIEDNRIDEAFFGIYLADVQDCRIADNVLRGTLAGEAASGNGIHLWSSRRIEIVGNTIAGHRDGIYLEFVHASRIAENTAERNLRYGLHFMYSDDCRYERNIFRSNTAGVAVMYTRRVVMIDNRFERNWGSASYGILLKEISDSRVEGNRFEGNSTGLLADGATSLIAHRNDFVENGWAIRLMASTQGARFTENNFIRNTFDLATNSRMSSTELRGNYWDAYEGYDLDRDGVGDVPFRPVRLFSLIVERNEPSLILLRSVFVVLLDAAERVLPVLTPASLADPSPSMRAIR